MDVHGSVQNILSLERGIAQTKIIVEPAIVICALQTIQNCLQTLIVINKHAVPLVHATLTLHPAPNVSVQLAAKTSQPSRHVLQQTLSVGMFISPWYLIVSILNRLEPVMMHAVLTDADGELPLASQLQDVSKTATMTASQTAVQETPSANRILSHPRPYLLNLYLA